MTYILYSPDGAIDEFFNSNTTVTRQQCDEFTISRAGGISSALQMQGVCSYTMTAGPNKTKLFQFRDKNSTIDIGNIIIAKAIYPEFVTNCKYLGTRGDSRPVYIYEMEYLPGTTYIMARIPPDNISRQYNPLRTLQGTPSKVFTLFVRTNILEQVLCTVIEQQSTAILRYNRDLNYEVSIRF